MTNTSHELFSGIGFTVMEKRKGKHKTEESSHQPTAKVPRAETISDTNVEELNVTHWFGQNDLFNAVLQGNLEVVQTILSCREEDVNITDAFGQTALFAAIWQDNVEVVQALLNHGVDVNVTDKEGQTALFAAAEGGNVEVVQALLNHGVDVNVTDKEGQTALFAAVECGNVEVVEALLSHGVNVNATDYQSHSALFAAVLQGSVEVVEVLLIHGADPNVADEYMYMYDPPSTPNTLFAAVMHGNVEVVQALLSHGADVNACDQYSDETALVFAVKGGNLEVVQAFLTHGVDMDFWQGQAALFDAIRQGNIEIVQTLLSHGVDANGIHNNYETVLFAAAEVGNVEVVQALLTHGADVNETSPLGQTALFAAIMHGNVEVVQVLLSHGADVNEMNVSFEQGDTPLFIAIRQENVELVQVLLSHGVNETSHYGSQSALFAAAWQGNVKIVQMILSHDHVDVNATTVNGQTALFAAVKGGSVRVVQALLNRGVDVSVIDQSGQTALFAAAKGGSVRVVQALLDRGVDVSVIDQCGQTALFAAAKGGSIKVVQALLNRGVDVSINDQSGQTALFAASEGGYVKIVEALLSHGVDVNVTDVKGQTALFDAAEGGNVKVVEALLSHGVDVSVTDQLGQTALFAAARQGNVEVVQGLLSHGVDVSVTDKQGWTALFYAVQNGNLVILDSLVKHGASTNAVDNTGNSALFYTSQLIMKGISSDAVIQIIKFLMSNGASADATNAAGETLLLHFLSYSTVKKMDTQTTCMVCQFLVESKVDVSVRTHCGHSMIHLVLLLLRKILTQDRQCEFLSWRNVQSTSKMQVAKGLLNLISSILSSPSCSKRMVVSRDDHHGNTPLHLWASLPYPSMDKRASHFESIQSDLATQLLSNGAQVNITNGNGKTPLHMAKTWSAVKLLLAKGALPNATDPHWNTPLLSRIKWKLKNPPFVYNVYDNMEAKTLHGTETQWEKILNSGMDPWKGNDQGTTILSSMLQTDAFNVIQTFLEATGALSGQKNPVDSNGDTPLHVICRDSGENNFWKLNLIDYVVRSGAHIVSRANRKGETALHIVCQRKNDDHLSCKIIQRLRAYGAQTDIPDGEGKTCLEIAEDKPGLMTLLTQDIKLFETKPWLPWSSKSEKHKVLLAQVARGQSAHQTDSFYYHTTPIGSGAFGHVYAGLHSKDGREVAVKRIEKVRMRQPEGHREIRNLVHLRNCEHVVRYHSYHGDQNFLYIVLELMEGTLEKLLNGEVKKEEVSLCQDVLLGLDFLHQNDIIHRDIKPGNILYKCNPKLSLKLADFGLSVRAANSGVHTSTVMHSKAGTRCWMAPELLKGTLKHSKASDVFACGLVLHYLLSRKKHPFRPEDVAGKGILEVENETVTNILKKKLMVDGVLSQEAQDLVKSMVNCNKDDRPSAAEALRHPLFWSNEKKFAFLNAVGNQLEVKQPRHSAHNLSPVEQDLENSLGPQFATKPWNEEVKQIYTEMTLLKKFSKYETKSAVDLLRFVRNTDAHITDLTQEIQRCVLQDYVFLVKFPTLVMDVYKTVTTHSWDQRELIASAMNKS